MMYTILVMCAAYGIGYFIGFLSGKNYAVREFRQHVMNVRASMSDWKAKKRALRFQELNKK